jgi:hypothetical protein
LSEKTINNIIEKTSGDLRSSINELQYQINNVKTRTKINKNKNKPIKKNNDKSVDNLKDNYINLQHSLGRVLYMKSKIKNKKENENGKLKHSDMDKIIEESNANEDQFLSYFHNNLTNFCSEIDDLSLILEDLSTSDEYVNYWSSDSQTMSEMKRGGFNLATRGYLVNNKNNPNLSYSKITSPSINYFEIKNSKKVILDEFNSEYCNNGFSSSFFLIYFPFFKQLNLKNDYLFFDDKKKKLLSKFHNYKFR